MREIGDEQETRLARCLELSSELVPLQQEEEGHEHRQLQHEREARGERVHLVLLVELHRLLLQALLVVLVLGLDLLDLRLESAQRVHRADLLDRQRQDQEPHDHRERHDRPSPAEAGVVVQPLDHPVGRVDQRLEDVRERKVHRNRRCSLTGSYPPWLNGLQRSSRQPASTVPRNGP